MIGRKKRFRVPRISTVIGSETVIEGNLSFEGGLHLDGTVHGDVFAAQDDRSTLIISDTGTVEGDVSAPNVILNGKVVGNVLASGRVELAANARVTGTLYYNLLEMEMGAEVNGQLVFREDGEEPQQRGDDDRAGSDGRADSFSRGEGVKAAPEHNQNHK